MIKGALEQLTQGGLDAVNASVFLQPPRPKKKAGDEPPLGQVNIQHAFSSPENLLKCTDFLRQHISQSDAQAAVIVTPKSKIAYPCVWKNKKKGTWKFGDSDGIFLQLEAPHNIRQMYFTELQTKGGQLTGVGETALLDVEEFEL